MLTQSVNSDLYALMYIGMGVVRYYSFIFAACGQSDVSRIVSIERDNLIPRIAFVITAMKHRRRHNMHCNVSCRNCPQRLLVRRCTVELCKQQYYMLHETSKIRQYDVSSES